MNYINQATVLSFTLYLMLIMSIGIVAFRLTRNLSDYVLGGRSLGGAVAALSAGASDMSSWLLMGLPGAVYLLGLQEIWLSCGLSLGAYLCWRIMAKPLRIYSEEAGDSLTIPAYLDNRFKQPGIGLRLIPAMAIVVFFIFYIAAGLYASGLLLSETFHLSYHQGLFLGTGIIMAYTIFGGFLAVSWTDFFQGSLMLLCLWLVPVLAMGQLGGFAITLGKIYSLDPEYLACNRALSPLKLLSYLSWGLGYFGMPHILVRFMAVKSVGEIPLARRVCMSWMILSLMGAVLVGMMGIAYLDPSLSINSEMIFMILASKVLPAWMVGIILAAILASCMCAIDSQMLAASSAITEDFYRALLRKKASQRELMWVGRLSVILITGIAIAIAYTPQTSIMDLVSFAWAGLGSTFAATMILSLFWRRMTHLGACAGMILGGSTAIAWKLLGLNIYVYELLPGTIISCIGVILVSLWDRPPSILVLKEFDKVQGLVRA